jgi:seryl-tRNA synthetase
MNEAEVTQMLRDAIDQDPKGRVWHVNTKHLVAFAQMVADKTRREMSSPTEWEAYIYEQGESKEEQKKADEAAWANDENIQNVCNTHPNAPHGFLRNASHNAGRYVCECEHWEEPK